MKTQKKNHPLPLQSTYKNFLAKLDETEVQKVLIILGVSDKKKILPALLLLPAFPLIQTKTQRAQIQKLNGVFQKQKQRGGQGYMFDFENEIGGQPTIFSYDNHI